MPIYKEGSKAEVIKNYRPLYRLTSVACKVMESIIRDHVMAYCIEKELFSSKQYGFSKGRSTVLPLLNFIDDWSLKLKVKLIAYMTLKRHLIKFLINN